MSRAVMRLWSDGITLATRFAGSAPTTMVMDSGYCGCVLLPDNFNFLFNDLGFRNYSRNLDRDFFRLLSCRATPWRGRPP